MAASDPSSARQARRRLITLLLLARGDIGERLLAEADAPRPETLAQEAGAPADPRNET